MPEHNPYNTYRDKPPAVSGGTLLPRFVLDSPYAPQDEGRSCLASEVLHSLRDGWEEVRGLSPQFKNGLLGMTIIGSSVKGRLHDQSDIDPFIFFDPNYFPQLGPNGVRAVGSPNLDEMTIATRHIIRSKMEKFGRTFADSRLHMEPMSKSRLDRGVEVLERTNKDRPQQLDAFIGNSIVEMFYMRIGSGTIQDYRAYLIGKLAMSKNGEKFWRSIVQRLGFEEEMRRGAKIYLPQTLEDAKGYFRLPESGILAESKKQGVAAEKEELKLKNIGRNLIPRIFRS